MPGARRWRACTSNGPWPRCAAWHAEMLSAEKHPANSHGFARGPAASPPDDGVQCPFCQATRPELVSLFGSQLLTSQYRCRACGSYFEAVRYDSPTREEEKPDGG